MPLIAVGVNHRTAAVDVRERLSVATSQMVPALDALRAVDGIDGVAVLSTCNRVEAIVSASGEDVIEPIVNWLTQRAGTGRAELEKHVYILRHGDVLKHLFRVAVPERPEEHTSELQSPDHLVCRLLLEKNNI